MAFEGVARTVRTTDGTPYLEVHNGDWFTQAWLFDIDPEKANKIAGKKIRVIVELVE